MRDTGNWARLLAFVTGLVNQELLLQNEYLAAENRILKAHLPSRLRLSDPERSTLAEIGTRLGRKRLKHLACTAKPDTILAWYRRLIARKQTGTTKWHLVTLLGRFDRGQLAWCMRMHRDPSKGCFQGCGSHFSR